MAWIPLQGNQEVTTSLLVRVFQCLILFAGNLHDYHTTRIINIVLHFMTINSPLPSCLCVCVRGSLWGYVCLFYHACVFVSVCVRGVFINLLNGISLCISLALLLLLFLPFTLLRAHAHTHTHPHSHKLTHTLTPTIHTHLPASVLLLAALHWLFMRTFWVAFRRFSFRFMCSTSQFPMNCKSNSKYKHKYECDNKYKYKFKYEYSKKQK